MTSISNNCFNLSKFENLPPSSRYRNYKPYFMKSLKIGDLLVFVTADPERTIMYMPSACLSPVSFSGTIERWVDIGTIIAPANDRINVGTSLLLVNTHQEP